MIKKQYKIYSKNRDAFQYGSGFYGNCWSGKQPKLWKTLFSAIERIERDLCGLRTWYSKDEDPIDLSKVEDIEIVEYEIVLKEINRYNVKDIVTERQRERMIRKEFGSQVAAMYKKIRDTGLDNFQYLMVFNTYDSFKKAKVRLKELDISHGKQYRYCQYVIIFENMDDATITKLTFADNTSEVYDINTLKKLDIGGQN